MDLVGFSYLGDHNFDLPLFLSLSLAFVFRVVIVTDQKSSKHISSAQFYYSVVTNKISQVST
jgi:hypothetical protein